MSEGSKKFTVPVVNDEDSEDESNRPRYFQAGQIIGNVRKKIENNQHKDLTETRALGSEQSAEKSDEMHVDLVEHQVTVANDHKIRHETVSGSKFEKAFSNLRSSKFYDEVDQTESESNVEKLPKSTNALLVNPRQRGNPLLKHIRNVPWEYNEMEPDYVMGKTTCALFLSMRYHNLFPNYIHERLKALGKSYQLRVLLVQVDVLEPVQPLKDLSVIAILADCTLMVAWSAEEAGNYLETYKMFENKSADLIKEKQGVDNYTQMIDCLTSIRSINKTDAVVLLSTFGTLGKIIEASAADLAMCPGMGPLKAKRLYEALRKPLKNEARKML